jgi:hypothetical protein
MGSTPIYALPFPEATDPADVPLDVRELAERLEAVVVPGVAAGQIPVWDNVAKRWVPKTPLRGFVDSSWAPSLNNGTATTYTQFGSKTIQIPGRGWLCADWSMVTGFNGSPNSLALRYRLVDPPGHAQAAVYQTNVNHTTAGAYWHGSLSGAWYFDVAVATNITLGVDYSVNVSNIYVNLSSPPCPIVLQYVPDPSVAA